MPVRQKISGLLLLLGLILAFLPLSGKYSFHGKPDQLLEEVLADSTCFTPDQVARWMINEDSTVQFIDVRSPEEFASLSIPGAMNIPYSDLLSQDLESYLNRDQVRNVFYGNDDDKANYAFVIAKGLGFKNSFVMEGGLNNWYGVVMNSEFTGDKISARENALFETRTRARRMFTEWNSMPDSLKAKFRESREIERKKLDGGCE
jgi:rhodanese-related sulfurtransferase